jgi:hypothetical protein
MRFLIMTVLMASTVVLVASCQPIKAPPPKLKKPVAFKKCTEPRPEVCTTEYFPVCASKDTGVRCVTTPCPSTENKTYSTACTACADPKVHGYVMEACEK